MGVALTTLATMVLELSLVRIFSVVFYHHFAFLVISIALFGLGAGGLFAYAFRGRSRRLFWKLGGLAVANSGVIVVTLAFVLTRQGDPDGATLALVYLMSALPFFFAGTIISTAIAETVERVERVYFFDLLGAAAGCLLLVPLLNFIGGPNAVIGSAILFAAASAIWFTLGASVMGRIVAVGVALGLVGLIVLNLKQSVVDVKYAKGERLAEEYFVKWNSFSRIALAEESATGKTSIHINAGASSTIPRLDSGPLNGETAQRFLASDSCLPNRLRPAAKTLIIGPGGGEDVVCALASGSESVTGVEINPIIAGVIMRERFAGLSGGLYSRPEVRIVVGEGRSFIRRSQESYGVLRVTQFDTRNASREGAHALSENSLLTVEAFGDYLSHLTADGVMAFTHWAFDPPRESLRVVVLAMEALRRLGETEQWRHVAVVRGSQAGDPADTVLISRSPLRNADLERIRELTGESGMSVTYLPGGGADNPFAGLLLSDTPESYLDQYQYNVGLVDDNRPFFNYTAQTGDLLRFLRNGSEGNDPPMNRAVPMLFRLVGVSLLATAIVLTLPPLFLGGRLPKEEGVARFLWYFVFIGAGYILIQVSLIQKFVLFLENPTYALTVIIFSMLVSSGIGSLYSRRLAGVSERSLMGALATVSLLVALLAVLIPPLTTTGAGWPLALKVLLTVLLIAPAGFVMGIAFPAGLAHLEERHKESVRWAWALNAAASVLGSAVAIFLAIHLGLRETLLVGGVMYLCALVSVSGPRRGGRATEA